MSEVIDAHSHFLPAVVVEALRSDAFPHGRVEDRGGQTWIVAKSGLEFPLMPLFYDAQTKLDWMDERKIDRALVSASAPFFLHELTPAEDQIALQRATNDAAAELAKESGGRLIGVATVPITMPEEAAAELRRANDELGLKGVEIGTSVGQMMLDDLALDVFYQTAEELRAPVFLHPYTGMLGLTTMPGFDKFFLQNNIGNGLETHIAAARLTLGGVFDRFPGLKVHLAHGGGAFPYGLARLDHTYGKRAQVSASAERPPSSYLDNFLFDTVVYGERQLEFLLSLVGPRNVVFGTDNPFDIYDMTGYGFSAAQEEPVAAALLCENTKREYGL